MGYELPFLIFGSAFAVCMIAGGIYMFGYVRGQSDSCDYWHEVCVKKGIAYWHVSDNGSTDFKWKGEECIKT